MADSYGYETLKPDLFTDSGQRSFIKIRDHVLAVLPESGAITMGKATIGTGDSWLLLACVDRMVELGDIVEVKQAKPVAGQDRIFRLRRNG